MFRPCVVIPVYNHADVLVRTLAGIRRHGGLPVILVDDGSDEDCHRSIQRLVDADDALWLLCRAQNDGKGAAVKSGLIEAWRRGFTHALQIDADGQHNSDDIPRFLEAAECRPDTLFAGAPIFDSSVPKLRLYSRYLTHVWVWINTLSLDIRDSMCGFRVYPLAPAVDLIERVPLGDRMDFDIEFLVRWHWQGLPLLQLETRVRYPEDGVSHFLPWRDNWLISAMHARLFFGMLTRLPGTLRKALVAGGAS